MSHHPQTDPDIYGPYKPDAGTMDMFVNGRADTCRLRSGLALHMTDGIEQDLAHISFQRSPGLSIFLVLQGGIEFQAESKVFRFGNTSRDTPVKKAEGWICSFGKPTTLCRKLHPGIHTRKILVSVDADWFSASAGEDHDGVSGIIMEFYSKHLSSVQWEPSARSVALAEQLLSPPSLAPVLKQMYLESRAIEITMEALQNLSGQELPAEREECPTRTLLRAQAARRYIDDHLDQVPGLSDIARHSGFSVSSLQRHFKATFSTTVVDYVRSRKLARAREAIEKGGSSVSEAAYMAGYNSVSSFTTAFKRTFGFPPGMLRG